MINGPKAMQYAAAERQTQQGGDWFFWIAGFSLVNSLIALFGQKLHFVIGLGTTELFDALSSPAGSLPRFASLALDILAAGFYVLYGFFARKGAKWAFLTGMGFYALDGLLLLVFKDWLSVAFHAYALYRIFQGFQAARQLGLLRAQQTVMPRASETPGVWPPPPNF